MTIVEAVRPLAPTQVAAQPAATALPALVAFFDALNRRGLRYCHWKSNSRLEWSLAGRTDLDLLVDPAQAADFRELLHAHQMLPVRAPVGKEYPGLENYLGFDAARGRLFHLHVHYRLVLGEQFVKNYELPLEQAFLATTRLHHGVRIPAPELELIVLCLRALLKYRDRDGIKDVLMIRSPGIPAHIRDEILWLLGQTTPERVQAVVQALPAVSAPGLIRALLDCMVHAPRDGRTLLRLRRQARQLLHTRQRTHRLQAVMKYFQELGRRSAFAARLRGARRFRQVNRGTTIALIGVDGAGKTTLSQAGAKWLAEKMDVQLLYMGSKQPSRRSEWLYRLFRIARRSHHELTQRLHTTHWLARRLQALRQSLLYCHYLSVGYDRYRRYRQGLHAAQSGVLVIFDRFPFVAPLDGPEVERLAGPEMDRAARFFARWEHHLYQRFTGPDCVLVLQVSPEVSLQRKPDHPAATIQAKNAALQALTAAHAADFQAGRWIAIDADQPYETAMSQLKTALWRALA